MELIRFICIDQMFLINLGRKCAIRTTGSERLGTVAASPRCCAVLDEQLLLVRFLNLSLRLYPDERCLEAQHGCFIVKPYIEMSENVKYQQTGCDLRVSFSSLSACGSSFSWTLRFGCPIPLCGGFSFGKRQPLDISA